MHLHAQYMKGTLQRFAIFGVAIVRFHVAARQGFYKLRFTG